uniref:Uncharacterized protein n=1 Tax=Nelumbo nucifera TaxID=4432 RepID=A0A822Y410_NELNU|nr:TPA_asm: hypothetical protein HUJ06_027243 [Nelumbo nucifera]
MGWADVFLKFEQCVEHHGPARGTNCIVIFFLSNNGPHVMHWIDAAQVTLFKDSIQILIHKLDLLVEFKWIHKK